MKYSSIKIRTWLIAGAMIAAAIYLYYSHLSGIAQLNSDENRVYHWNPFTPMLYFICRPFTNYFRNQDAPYYVMATIGMMNLSLVFWLTRTFFKSGVAFWAAAFYLVNDFVLGHTRLLYYSTPLVLMMLIAMSAYAMFQRERGWRWLLLSAAMPGVMFYTNPSAYAIIAGLLAWMLWVELTAALGSRKRQLFAQAVTLAVVAVAAYAACEAYSYWAVSHRPDIPYKPQWKCLFSYRELNASCGAGPRYLVSTLADIWRYGVTVSLSHAYRGLMIIAAVAGSVVWCWRRRDAALGAFVVFGFVGGALTLACVIAGTHGLYPRNVLWIYPLLAVGFGFAADRLMHSKSRVLQRTCIVLLVIYFTSAGAYGWALTRSFFSVNSINDYLKEQGIPKTRVMTEFQINRYEDFASGRTTISVPITRTYRPEDMAKNIYHYIHWPAIYKIYRDGKADYYLSSSIGNIANVGINDTLLENTAPIKTWENHPLNNSYAPVSFSPLPVVYRIRLYALKDIFASAKALANARRAQSGESI